MNRIHTKWKFPFFLLFFLTASCLHYSCRSVGPNCGNEKHVVKAKNKRNNVSSCGNERPVVRKHKKVKKSKKQGVLGKSRHKSQWKGSL